MPTLLHDTAVRDSIRARVQSLTPNATRKWGKMTVDQMLWHCNQVLKTALGHHDDGNRAYEVSGNPPPEESRVRSKVGRSRRRVALYE